MSVIWAVVATVSAAIIHGAILGIHASVKVTRQNDTAENIAAKVSEAVDESLHYYFAIGAVVLFVAYIWQTHRGETNNGTT